MHQDYCDDHGPHAGVCYECELRHAALMDLEGDDRRTLPRP